MKTHGSSTGVSNNSLSNSLGGQGHRERWSGNSGRRKCKGEGTGVPG